MKRRNSRSYLRLAIPKACEKESFKRISKRLEIE